MALQIGLPPIQAGMDFRVSVARYRAALVKANLNIARTGQCLALIDKLETNGK